MNLECWALNQTQFHAVLEVTADLVLSSIAENHQQIIQTPICPSFPRLFKVKHWYHSNCQIVQYSFEFIIKQSSNVSLSLETALIQLQTCSNCPITPTRIFKQNFFRIASFNKALAALHLHLQSIFFFKHDLQFQNNNTHIITTYFIQAATSWTRVIERTWKFPKSLGGKGT